MNTNDNESYNPSDDDNQGVVQLMAQAQEANSGVAQNESINPIKASGPEPEKAEVDQPDNEALNEDVTTEKKAENGEINLKTEKEE